MSATLETTPPTVVELDAMMRISVEENSEEARFTQPREIVAAAIAKFVKAGILGEGQGSRGEEMSFAQRD